MRYLSLKVKDSLEGRHGEMMESKKIWDEKRGGYLF